MSEPVSPLAEFEALQACAQELAGRLRESRVQVQAEVDAKLGELAKLDAAIAKLEHRETPAPTLRVIEDEIRAGVDEPKPSQVQDGWELVEDPMTGKRYMVDEAGNERPYRA